MLKVKFILLVFNLFLFFNIFSQKGKDGVKTVSTANVKVNAFTALTSSVSIGSTTISVTSSSLNTNFTSTLTAGDLIMVIQMQGAFTKLFGYTVPWQPDSTYGYIWNYATCGNYEFAEVKSVISATQIELTCGLNHAYTSAGKTQIVRVPRYTTLTVSSTGTLTTDAWNGAIGGVLVAEVSSNTIVDGVISANGLGFRGGIALGNGGSGNGNFATRNPNDGAEKGEGVGSDRLSNGAPDDTLGRQCKGAAGNAGGGGNANNCGGGGGANGGNINGWNGYGIANLTYSSIFDLEWAGRASVVSSGGGKGGYGTSRTTTVNINTVGPNKAAWGSSLRPSYGGFGGRPLDYSTGKLFMGGGGGAGHMTSGSSTNAGACSGGTGGGIIYILNYGTISGTGTINSNGSNGGDAAGGGVSLRGIDGAGGAGSGGTIILQSNGSISITTNANGGNGGNQIINFPASTSEGQGPGGGGSGGYIAATNTGFTQNINGGANGTTNATAFATDFPMNGATSGDVGTSNQVITPSFSLSASINQTICTNQTATVTATSTNTNATIEWYNSLSGNSVATGTLYTTPTYTAAGTYTVYAGSCPGIYRLPIIITVNTGATFSITSKTICPGQSAVLTATTSASSYTWNTTATTLSISVTPTITSTYTISSSNGVCTSSQTATVTVSSTPTISVPNATICSGTSTVLTASGSTTSYTWMPGSIISPTISSSSNINYTITGSNGTCTNSTTATVTVASLPTVSVSNATICSGTSTVLTASGTSTSFTWMPGSITTSTISASSNATYTITGNNGTCTNSTTATVTVVSLPTVSVPNATICSGTSTVLTASGSATNFTWMPGNLTTSTISANANANYTITGSNSTCTNSTTVTVSVNSLPTVSVSNATICSGTSTVLTASGSAISFTWMPGSITTSTISANSNGNYSITGSDGVCTNTTTSTVSVTPTPTITGVPSTITICPSQTATFTAGGATSFTWQPNNFVGGTYTIAPVSNSVISVIGANGTCTSSTTASITIGSGISPSVDNPTICVGETATLTAANANTYTWSTTANTNSIVVTPTSTTVYTVTGSVGTCTGITTATVSVIDQPTLAITGNTNICSGSSTTLTAIGTATSYTWQSGGQTTNTISVNPNTTTIYTITGGNGVCTNSVISTVSVTPTPTITGVSDTQICTNQTATFTAGGATTYTWQPNNFVGGTYTIAPLSNSVISVIGANETCTASATASITIGSGILPSVNNPTICVGETATLTATNANTYTWSTGISSNSIVVTPTSTTVYTVTGSVGTCTGITTVTVSVINQPTFAITGNTNICSGSSTTLTASGSATSYTWMPGSITTSTISSSSNINYTITGSDGTCTNSTTATVTVASLPTVSVPDVTICAGTSTVLTASGTATSFTWMPGNIITSTISASSNVTYTITGYNGSCSNTTTVIVSVLSLPTVSVSNATICAGTSTILTISGTVTNYTWMPGSITTSTISANANGNYTITGSNSTCTNSTTATVSVTSLPTISVPDATICSGTSTVLTASGSATSFTWMPGSITTSTISANSNSNYSITGSDGVCTNTTISTVSVTPTPTITGIPSTITICPSQTATFTAGGASSFTWQPGNFVGATYTIAPLSNSVISVIGASETCSSSFTTTIAIDNTTLTTNSISVATCPSQTVALFGTGTNSTTTTYTWSNGINSYSQTVAPINTTTYVVNGNSLSGCPALSGTVVVNVNSIAANFSGLDANIMTVGETLNLTDISIGATSIEWDYCDGVSVSNQITIPLADVGTCCIKLVATNASCKDSITKCVNIVNEAAIIIPNVFTPNGDTKNDLFKIHSVGVKSLNCTIYDRWGLKLYEWDGINGFWDGSAKSGSAPAGTYFYIINYTDEKDKSTTEKGFLTLFKD